MLHHTWRSMLLYSLVVWVCSSVVLTPLTSWILHHLAGYGDVIVGNYSIHLWLLTPRGIIYLLLAGSIVFFSLIIQMAGLFRIAQSMHNSLLPAALVLRDVLFSAHSLLRLSLTIFVICLPCVPLLAIVPLAAKYIMLSNHDINYYLTHHPPEWYITIAISVLWIIPIVCILLFIFVRYLYTFHVWLDGKRPLRRALRASKKATQGMFWNLLRVGMSCVGIWMASMFLFDFTLYSITKLLLINYIDTLEGVVRVMSGYIIVVGVSHGLLSWIGLSWLACVWTICYSRDVKQESTPAVPVLKFPKINPLLAARNLFSLRITIAVLILIFVGSGLMSSWMFNHKIPVKLPQIIAHRAGPADAPENSLSGLKKVLKDDFADIVEIDVTLSLDGELVVAHDKDLMKQAGDPSIIRETNFDDLQKIDIGKMYGTDFKLERLGRLDDFLIKVKGRMPIIIEFKHGQDSDLVEKTIEAVREREMQQEVILMSLELEEVRKVQELAPEIRVGYFASVEMGDLTELNVYCIGAKDWMCNPKFIRDVQEQGMLIYSWTVDDTLRMVELIEAGIDGIITNDPVLAAEVLKKVDSISPATLMLLRFRKFWGVFDEMGWW